MPLERLTSSTFKMLEESWKAQCDAFDEDFSEFAPERLEQARKVAAEDPPDRRYGIYALSDGSAFDALLHGNKAQLPSSTGHTFRMVWVLLAPKFDFDDLDASEFARVSRNLINASLEVARNDTSIHHIKIHLGNFADRQYFSGVADGLAASGGFWDSRIRGNWIHLSPKRDVLNLP